ncbi:hypothetical protein BJX99DRAFT_66479 [Aspergillus californicus]
MAESDVKNILILGGSYAGASIAHYTLKHTIPALPAPSSYQVVIVSPAREVYCRPAGPRALIADKFFDQSKLFVNLEAQFKQYGDKFRFIHGSATRLDHDSRVVTVAAKDGTELQLPYHALVIATGSSTPSPLLSLNADDSSVLKENWKTFREALPSATSIVVAGGGPTAIETAGELGEHLNGRIGLFGSKPASPKVKITVVTSANEILPYLRPALGRTAEGYLDKLQVTVVKGVKVESVSPVGAGSTQGDITAKTEVKLSNGETLTTDLYIPAYGTTPNTGFVDESLRVADGRVDTNPQTLRVDKAGPRVYAAGDASNAARPAIHILFEAIPALGANLKRDLLLEAGETPAGTDRVFKADETETQLVPIGQSKGVGSGMGWKIPSFFVWLIKGRDYWVSTTGALWSGQQWAKEK